MAMLELECPSCGELLELDAGFAGSVCRCSSCGTLMTVPTDPNAGAERLKRPDAPPGVRPETPKAPKESAAPKASAKDEGTQEPSKHDAGPQNAEAMTTTSGREVDQEQDPSVPVASKRQSGLRTATKIVLVLVILALVGWTAGVLIFTVGGRDQDDAAEEAAMAQFGYDPSVNPYTLSQLNVLALPLHSRSAIIVDASGSGRRWLGLVQDAVRVGLTQDNGAAEVGLVYATEDTPRTLAVALEPASQLTAERIHTFQETIAAGGVAPLAPAVETGAAWQPSQIVLITGQRLDASQTVAIEAALAEAGDVQLDIVLVDETSGIAEALTTAHDGQYVQLSLTQLQQWYQTTDVPMP